MPRPCTICNHPQRGAIDLALATGDPVRNIAERFDTTHTALLRHRANHLAGRLARAKQRSAVDASRQQVEDQRLVSESQARQAADDAFDLDVLNELQRCVRRLVRLMDACEQYLRDPDDPERYDLTPRAESVIVSYSECGEGGARVRKRAPLSQLLDRASGVVPTARVEFDAAGCPLGPAARLLIQAAGRIQAQLQLLV